MRCRGTGIFFHKWEAIRANTQTQSTPAMPNPVQNKDRYNRQAAVDNRDNPSNAGGKPGRGTIR